MIGGVTTDFVLDLNAGLTQVLQEETNTYLYGMERIQQTTGVDSAYFLGDALGSVRQLVGEGGQIDLVRSYEPYGNVLSSYGSGKSSSYAFTGEWTDDTNLINLRSRLYSSGVGRFLMRDTWAGDLNVPMSYTKWVYGYSNPIVFLDPSGKSSCYSPLSSYCQNGLAYVSGFARALKGPVTSGALAPVEAFAMLVDLSKTQFDGDVQDLVWALTIVLDDFDVNRGAIWKQVPAIPSMFGGIGSAGSDFFIGQNWLPYKNNGMNIDWCDPLNPTNCEGKWVHSLIGDWNEKYWDKTANQAYHFWFYVAVTVFDGRAWAELANNVHDREDQLTNYDFIYSKPTEPPPLSNVPSHPDRDLAFQGMDLGGELSNDILLQSLDCSLPAQTDIGSWIRSHLKK